MVMVTKPLPRTGNETEDWVGKRVSETFNELFAKISSQAKFHCSEQYNLKKVTKSNISKEYDVFNSYHAFCRLCEQHLYSRSVAEDINSFFQKHMNTSYHRQNRGHHLPPDDTPIFTWEEKFFSGRCNVCDMPGVNSYILNTDVEAPTLFDLHVCDWSKEQREMNDSFLGKLKLLKKYCRLTIFQEKYLKTVQGRNVCLLCQVSFPPSERKPASHLSSDLHYRNFYGLVKKHFGFELKDLLNGFNLENVTRWAITSNLRVSTFTEYDERKECLQQSNNDKSPYENFSPSFSPKLWRNLLGKDSEFIQNGECLLWDVEFKPRKEKTQMPRPKVTEVDSNSFDSPKNYVVYLRNQEKLFYISNIMQKLNLGILDEGSKDNSDTNFFKKLIDEKLDKLKLKFVAVDEEMIECSVCNEVIQPLYDKAHLNSPSHSKQSDSWKFLEGNFGSSKLSEPFIRISQFFACLLCGVVFAQKDFFSHLLNLAHISPFERYCKLDTAISISSAFQFGNVSCCCKICHAIVAKNWKSVGKKKMLQNVKAHWPCPKLNVHVKAVGNDQDKTTATTPDYKTEDFTRVEESVVRIADKTTATTPDYKTVDFTRVEESVVRIVDVFENKIIYHVRAISKNLINNLESSRKTIAKNAVENETVQKQSSAAFRRSDTSITMPPPNVLEKEERGRKVLRRRVRHAERSFKTNATEPATAEEKEEEILVVEGLPRFNLKGLIKKLKATFREFGQVHGTSQNVGKDKARAIFVFAKPGMAKAAAGKGPELILNKFKLTMRATTTRSLSEEDLSLSGVLVPLLENSQVLMDFLLNLMERVRQVSDSPLALMCEEMICRTIISVLVGRFPKARCYPFGSRLSGLVLGNSDLDIFLDCGDMFDGSENTSEKAGKKLIKQISELLRKNKEFTDFIVVRKAKVPIISFQHKPSLVHCDLSFKNGLSVQNTLLVKFLMSLDWRVKPLVLFFKHWASLHELHGSPLFTSYALIMLVVFYLEQLECPVLPTIESLQASFKGRRRTIAGWDCSINGSSNWKSKNSDSIPVLLLGLFNFYRNFNYNKYMISSLTGKPLPREAYSYSGFTALPISYRRHVLNIPLDNITSTAVPIAVIDPFELSRIITKNLDHRALEKFIVLCGKSATSLKKGIIAFQKQSKS